MPAQPLRHTFVLGAAALGAPAFAADLNVGVEIPRLNVAEYHRPYVAVWVARADQGVASNLAVWYEMKKANAEGTKWLKDMRQWWRRSGRELTVPVDGVTGPTRPVGTHALTFGAQHPELGKLPPGDYTLVVEAAREVGGRELVKVPFKWGGAGSGKAKGTSELGLVSVASKP